MALREFLLPWDSQPREVAEINRESWQARDLSLWYPLNGNTLDPVKNNLGTLNSGARFAASSRGLAAFFDGSDDYISWPSTTLGTGNTFTASAWVYYSGALGSRATVFGCENAATTFQLEVGGGAGGPTTGGVTAIYAGAVIGGTGNSVFAANTWTHIAYIKRGIGATSEFYINGVQTTTVTNNATNYTETASVRTLGRRAAASQLFSGMIQDARINNFAMSAQEVLALYQDGLQLFAPRSIWVPVSVGGSASAITAATGASTASTLGASSTAASTPTAAAGAATASTVAASSTAASAITSATGAATASTLTGSAVVAGAITAAAGVGTGGTLVGTGLTAGASAITPADGAATASTLTGSSVAASAITPAAGVATGQTLVSAGSISAASMTPAAGAASAATFAASAVAASVAVAAAGASSAQTMAATAQAVAAITAAAGVTTAATMASPAGALSNAEMRELYDWVKELHRIHGLTSGVDLVVTPTSRTAGAISQTIGEVGTTVTVTRV